MQSLTFWLSIIMYQASNNGNTRTIVVVQDFKKGTNAQDGFQFDEKCIWIDHFKRPKGIYAKQKYTSNKMYKPLDWLF